MAESQAVAKQALKKLEDQLTCAICLNAFKDPKLLQCFHVYCKDCLKRLVVKDQQGQLSLCCPTCRKSTLLPSSTGVSSLQSAFHIHHLLEIQDALEKVKLPKKVLCGKCTKSPQPATSYCRDCGEFICAICTTVHSQWRDFFEHEVVALEQFESKVKQLDALKKVTLYCSLHQGKELELYCETCEELICHNCTVNKHCRPEHKYDLVSDTFERHKAEIKKSLEPAKDQLVLVNKALEQLDLQPHKLNNQQAAIEADICEQIQLLISIIQARKAELISDLDQIFQMKMKNLAAQKDELKTVQTQLTSCLSFVGDSLKRGSQGEVMKMKKGVMKQIKEMIDNFYPDMLPPCEPANVKFSSPLLTQASQLQQFGELFLQQVSPEKCYAVGSGLEIAEPGERATAVLHIVDHKGKACTTPVETVTGELVSEKTGEKTDCSVKKVGDGQYEISYQPTDHRRHQLHIKVEGDHIKGSPFPVTLILPVQNLGTPIKTIGELKEPRGVALNNNGEFIVVESSGDCVSIFSPTGKKLQSFGSSGSGDGEFDRPRGVAVDGEGNILVVDGGNNRVQKFTSAGRFITAVGKKGNKPLEFDQPLGITIHPHNNKVYVTDNRNHCIQILNPDLTFYKTWGSKGSDKGQLSYPWDVACDSTGNVYVVNLSNKCIQVFMAEGEYLAEFGKHGKETEQLNSPSSITIDSNNVVFVTEDSNNRVSVFTCEGMFLTSFGTEGGGPGQFNKPRGITVDRNGVVYVCDTKNNRLQLF